MTVERRDRTIRIDGADLTYTVAGSRRGTPICFIPGWCGHRAFFTAQIEHFAADRFVIACDFPGFGDSRLAPGSLPDQGGAHDPMSLASCLISHLLALENVADCWLVGHSAGGALALDIAAANPGLARGVIGIDALINPSFYPQQAEEVTDAVVAPLEADFTTATRIVAETWFVPGTDPALKRRVIEMTLAADEQTAIAMLRAFLRWDMMRRLEIYRGFVGAIVAGVSCDEAAASALLHDRLSVRRLADVGHFLMMEQPARFNGSMERLIRSSVMM